MKKTMARIGLIDVDSHHFPNLPLMKIAAYHKSIGDAAEPAVPIQRYDKVYVSKIFTFTPDIDFVPQADETVYGGTGYNLTTVLPPYIESMCPDYDLYPQFSEAYGFLTRGCPRNCRFCIVSEKEGSKSVRVADLSEFWRGQKKIKLLDANILACNERENILQSLIDCGAYIDFTQGLDIRLTDKYIAQMLTEIKIEEVH